MTDVPHGVQRIADAHHHLWDLTTHRYPWLQDIAPDEAGAADLRPLQRSYLIEHYLADAADAPLVASVHVQAAHDPTDMVEETRWLQAIADRHRFPQAIVAEARLHAPDLESILARHVEHSNVRGIRQMLNWSPTEPVAERPDLMTDPAWRRGLARLAPLGLSFDLQVFPHQLEQAARVVAAAPDTQFILNHGGFLTRDAREVRSLWRRGLRLLARQPNLVVKASGYAAVDPAFSRSGLTAYFREILDAFGAERILFASNFPVERRSIDYRGLVEAYAAATGDLTPGERDAFFYCNAARIYRLT